ncbi:hypothetical protein BMR08_15115 [Methylococcaceae bacterium CS2]|nr:hypothetical protein BMR08_15115 [Methylococcaceae bacterium CS2]
MEFKFFTKILFFIYISSLSMFIQANVPGDSGYPLDTVVLPYLDVPVCWEDMNNDEYLRTKVKDAITGSWEKYSQLKFTGWEKCPKYVDRESFQGIRIGVKDQGAHTKGLGVRMIGKKNGMVLNFTMRKWNSACPAIHGRENCVTWIAIHEFGHALAFAHEQNRVDKPSSCKKGSQGTDGNVVFTKWDKDSIMNYCAPNYNGHGKLSPIDILTLQTYYGRIPTYNVNSGILHIEVLQVSGVNYEISMDNKEDKNLFVYSSRIALAQGESSKPAVFDESTGILTLPLVKVIDSAGHVISLYSAEMEHHPERKALTLKSANQIEPVPTDN